MRCLTCVLLGFTEVMPLLGFTEVKPLSIPLISADIRNQQRKVGRNRSISCTFRSFKCGLHYPSLDRANDS